MNFHFFFPFRILFFFVLQKKPFPMNSVCRHTISILCQWIHPNTFLLCLLFAELFWCLDLNCTIGKEVKLNQKLNILRWQWKMSCAVRSTLMHVIYSNNSSNFRFRWNSRVTELTSNDLLAMSTVHFIWSDNWRLLFMMRLPTVWWTLNSCHYFLYLSGQVFVRFVAIIILLKLATSSAKWASYELDLKWWCIFRTHFLNATKEYNGEWLPRFVSTKYLPFNA